MSKVPLYKVLRLGMMLQGLGCWVEGLGLRDSGVGSILQGDSPLFYDVIETLRQGGGELSAAFRV